MELHTPRLEPGCTELVAVPALLPLAQPSLCNDRAGISRRHNRTSQVAFEGLQEGESRAPLDSLCQSSVPCIAQKCFLVFWGTSCVPVCG